MVAFGDVNLSEEQIRGNMNPGAGGWPTIRYFNKETGPDGKPYPKKTSKAMCEELGDETYMQAYVEEYGGASLCSASDSTGCDEKEQEFIKRWNAASGEAVSSQLARLKGMAGSKMGDDQRNWLTKRIAILNQLVVPAKDEV
jgi:hypothetical protein